MNSRNNATFWRRVLQMSRINFGYAKWKQLCTCLTKWFCHHHMVWIKNMFVVWYSDCRKICWV